LKFPPTKFLDKPLSRGVMEEIIELYGLKGCCKGGVNIQHCEIVLIDSLSNSN
jgi:hypothetical protein